MVVGFKGQWRELRWQKGGRRRMEQEGLKSGGGSGDEGVYGGITGKPFEKATGNRTL